MDLVNEVWSSGGERPEQVEAGVRLRPDRGEVVPRWGGAGGSRGRVEAGPVSGRSRERRAGAEVAAEWSRHAALSTRGAERR